MGNGTSNTSVGLIKRTTDSAKANPLAATTIVVGLLGVAPLVTAAATFGIDLIPWPAKAEIIRLKQETSLLRADLAPIIRSHWERELEEAEADLAVDPNNNSAKKLKRLATGELRRWSPPVPKPIIPEE